MKAKTGKKQGNGFWTLLGLLALLALAGALEKQDVDLQVKTYCQNVRDGVWPDYAGSYASQCTAGNP